MNQLKHFPYKHVLVLGLAKSGMAAARLLIEQRKHVRINDRHVPEDSVIKQLQSMGAELVFGSHPLSVLDGIEIIVKNPGIPYENPILEEAERRKIPIITEVELAGLLADDAIIGITGSNGKTTTTTLLAHMLETDGQPMQLAGNIGTAASDAAQRLQSGEKLVLELSSFQLLGTDTFKPKIAVLLNIYEAHLDYHKTFSHYKQAKCRIFRNQTSRDFLIYNADNAHVVRAVQHAKASLVPFSVHRRLTNGAWADQSSIYFKDEKIVDRRDIRLVGSHNLENILAAMSAAKLNGVSNESIRHVLTTFTGIKHRLQFVAKVNDRLFYNDSKATNILATEKALASFKQPVILLAGGLDRGNAFDELLPYLTHVKAMVLFGETKEKLKDLADKAGISQVKMAANVTEAAQKAYALSNPNDVILLSPACASWDQYDTFEQRGDMFVQAVHTLL